MLFPTWISIYQWEFWRLCTGKMLKEQNEWLVLNGFSVNKSKWTNPPIPEKFYLLCLISTTEREYIKNQIENVNLFVDHNRYIFGRLNDLIWMDFWLEDFPGTCLYVFHFVLYFAFWFIEWVLETAGKCSILTPSLGPCIVILISTTLIL